MFGWFLTGCEALHSSVVRTNMGKSADTQPGRPNGSHRSPGSTEDVPKKRPRKSSSNIMASKVRSVVVDEVSVASAAQAKEIDYLLKKLTTFDRSDKL